MSTLVKVEEVRISTTPLTAPSILVGPVMVEPARAKVEVAGMLMISTLAIVTVVRIEVVPAARARVALFDMVVPTSLIRPVVMSTVLKVTTTGLREVSMSKFNPEEKAELNAVFAVTLRVPGPASGLLRVVLTNFKMAPLAMLTETVEGTVTEVKTVILPTPSIDRDAAPAPGLVKVVPVTEASTR